MKGVIKNTGKIVVGWYVLSFISLWGLSCGVWIALYTSRIWIKTGGFLISSFALLLIFITPMFIKMRVNIAGLRNRRRMIIRAIIFILFLLFIFYTCFLARPSESSFYKPSPPWDIKQVVYTGILAGIIAISASLVNRTKTIEKD